MSYHIRHCWLILLVFVLGITLPWTTAAADNNHMRQPISWVKSSETVPYPELNGRPNLWVKVSLKGNRTYIYSGKKLLYTMYSSAGAYQKDPLTHKMVSATPTGTFATSNIRMDRVYNPNLRLGANYCLSWTGTTCSIRLSQRQTNITTSNVWQSNRGSIPAHPAASACQLTMPSGLNIIYRPGPRSWWPIIRTK